MIDQLVSALLVAGVSGVTYIAYRHPTGYQKIHPLLHYGSLLALALFSVWNVAVDLTWAELSSFIATGKGLEALKAREVLKVPYLWLWVGCLGVNLYAQVLLNLPKILGPARGSKRD